MKATRNTQTFFLWVISLIFLFNPNISVIDPLPDFFAFYFISRLLVRAGDTAPYFEEARKSAIHLAWLSVAKLASLLVIAIVRGANNSDFDIVALFSLVFMAGEIIISVNFIRNLFRALFYLGERGDKPSIYTKLKDGTRFAVDPDVLCSISYLFVVVKCLSYSLPFMLLLSSDPFTSGASPRGLFPTLLTVTALLTLAIGLVWLIHAIRYAALTVKSGDFDSALDNMMSDEVRYTFERKRLVRSLSSVPTLFAFASVFSLQIAFSGYRSINIVPNLIIGILFFVLATKLRDGKTRSWLSVSSLVYTATSAVAYLFHIRFLRQFEYFELLQSEDARRAYLPVEIWGAIEFIAFIAMTLFLLLALRRFLLDNTGISRGSEKYRETDRLYHRSILARTYAMIALGALSGIARFLSVFINSEVQLIQLNPNDFSAVPIPAPTVPWFGALSLFVAIIYIAYSFYHAAYLKEEIRAKNFIE